MGRWSTLAVAAGAGLPRPAQVLPFPALVPGFALRIHSRDAPRSADPFTAVPRTEPAPIDRRTSHRRHAKLHDGNPQSVVAGARAPALYRSEVDPYPFMPPTVAAVA